jgi:hypothetical protein
MKQLSESYFGHVVNFTLDRWQITEISSGDDTSGLSKTTENPHFCLQENKSCVNNISRGKLKKTGCFTFDETATYTVFNIWSKFWGILELEIVGKFEPTCEVDAWSQTGAIRFISWRKTAEVKIAQGYAFAPFISIEFQLRIFRVSTRVYILCTYVYNVVWVTY